MDASLGIGMGLSAVGLLCAVLFGPVGFGDLVHPVAAAWVLLGTASVSFLSAPRREVLQAWRRLGTVFRGTPGDQAGLNTLAAEVGLVAQLARKEGILQMDPEKSGITHPLLKEMTKRIAEGVEIQQVDEVLRLAQARGLRQCEKELETWETLSAQSPTVGIIGAVFGLLPLLGILAEPEKIGAVMVFPFASTLYGLAFSAFVATPVASRLRQSMSGEGRELEMLRAGVRGIAEGVAPTTLEQKLRAMIE